MFPAARSNILNTRRKIRTHVGNPEMHLGCPLTAKSAKEDIDLGTAFVMMMVVMVEMGVLMLAR